MATHPEVLKLEATVLMDDHQKMVFEELGTKYEFQWNWLGGVISRVGPTVLDLIKQALELGLTREWVTEALDRLGPIILEMLLNVLSAKQSMTYSLHEGEVLEGGVEQKLLFNEMFKLLIPIILERFGPQIIEVLVKTVFDSLGKK